MDHDRYLGQQIDDYRLEALLGRGSMARTYLATDLTHNRQVALKLMNAGQIGEADAQARFRQEARAIALLDHPHIVRFYASGQADETLYIAMEVITGDSLAAVLQHCQAEGRYLPAARILRVIRQIGSALDYAHTQGIIHRDVKPQNILLEPSGRAVLTDFGLALIVAEGTRGTALGTPHYLPPEQARSSASAVPRSDLYSLGVILYEMLTNVRPFESRNAIEVAIMHISQAPRPPSTHRPAIRPALDGVVLRALAKKPEERFPTGAALADALAAALPGADASSA